MLKNKLQFHRVLVGFQRFPFDLKGWIKEQRLKLLNKIEFLKFFDNLQISRWKDVLVVL
jgi:hypothetical protein